MYGEDCGCRKSEVAEVDRLLLFAGAPSPAVDQEAEEEVEEEKGRGEERKKEKKRVERVWVGVRKR